MILIKRDEPVQDKAVQISDTSYRKSFGSGIPGMGSLLLLEGLSTKMCEEWRIYETEN
jgi:hypothetical protein